MPKLIVANWKMNPPTLAGAAKLARVFAGSRRGVKVVVCPPFIWLAGLSREKYPGLEFGAQDVFWENAGAYTGEVSPAMLKNSGVKYVILGHSERRRWLGEMDEVIGKKCAAALRARLIPILCVGEPLEVRKKGATAVLGYVRGQLARASRHIPKSFRRTIIVAYEPIWAIGTGIPCDAYEAKRMVRACAAYLEIKEKFKNVTGLYGGSVSARNAKAYLNAEYIDGLLVGGASLNPKEFRRILTIAQESETW